MRELAVENNGLTFQAYTDGPTNAPLILFLHGFPEFADMWFPIMRSVADAGFFAVAFDQRGYSPLARPSDVADYSVEHLVSDALAMADHFGAKPFHLVAHDWGGLLAWNIAASYPDRIISLTVLSTPHPNAFLDAMENDPVQKELSKYIHFLRIPGAAEGMFLADNCVRLRKAYEGKLPESAVDANVARFAAPGALTGPLNWYRALDFGMRIDPVKVPTLFIWGSKDLAIGEVAVVNTRTFVEGDYRFERLEGKSHWLAYDVPELISELLIDHGMIQGCESS